MNYGLPYKGSKNKLAPKIFELFPQKKNFYDLFCGGGAVTHYALLSNKFEKVYQNDINKDCLDLFIDAAKGKYRNETRWISREDFLNSIDQLQASESLRAKMSLCSLEKAKEFSTAAFADKVEALYFRAIRENANAAQ